MSDIAVIEAVESHLRGVSEFGEEVVGIEPGGNPPSRAGNFYVSIDSAGISNGGDFEANYLEEQFTVFVWISIRTGRYSRDKSSDIYRAYGGEMTQKERAIITAIHGNQNVRSLANKILSAPADQEGVGDQFVKPLFWISSDQPFPVGPDWSNDRGSGQNSSSWFVKRLTFRGCDRLQSLDCME